MELPLAYPSLPVVHDPQRRAALLLGGAMALGATTQALFWRTGAGLNVLAWDVLLVAANLVAFRRHRIAPTAWGAIASVLLLGFAIVRNASEWALSIALPVNLAVLMVLPVLLRDGLTLGGLAALPSRMLRSLLETPAAVHRAARVPAEAVGGRGRVILRGVTRGLLLGLPTAGLFTLLLSQDAEFSRVALRIKDQLGEASLFAVWTVLTSAGYVFSHSLHAAPCGEGAGVWTRRVPYRAAGDDDAMGDADEGRAGRVSTLTWAMVIGQVALIFGVFVVANLRQLFGGNALVRAPGGLTYAGYLHAGFAQLLLATVLSVCLVLAGHAALRPRGQASGAVPGGRGLAALEATLLGLTGITVASCWQRLQIYEDAYGASRLRLGVAVIELAILAVLVVTLAKVLVRRWTGHAGALLALFVGIAVFASSLNADGYVATTNLDRAARGKGLDVDYLASLSVDARAALDHPFVQADPDLYARLQDGFSSSCARTGLRSYRGLGRCPVW